MVIEDVMIETETTGRKRLRSNEVLVFSVRRRASRTAAARWCRKQCPGAMTRGPWWGRAAAVAHSGRQDHQGLSAGRGFACGVCRHGVVVAHVPWARPGAEAHLGFRRHLRVACRPHCIERAHRAAAHRVAHRGRDRGLSGRRWPRHQRSARWADPDRHR